MLNSSLYSSAKQSWATPQLLFEVLNDEFGFTLDVCADSTNFKCESYFDEDVDGLSKKWDHLACWMNPPYGREIKRWVAKARSEAAEHGNVIVCILPARTDTRWWHDHVMKAAEIRLLNKRLTFHGAGNKAPFPVAVVVFNGRSESAVLRGMNIG